MLTDLGGLLRREDRTMSKIAFVFSVFMWLIAGCTAQPTTSTKEYEIPPPPVASASLNVGAPTPDGLLTSTSSESEHIARTLQYYKNIDAPASFSLWKERFQFPPQEEGESLEAWRVRVGVGVYYNKRELGLGRELACTWTTERNDADEEFVVKACFVTNYGDAFSDEERSLALAKEGKRPKNTVCISERMMLPEGERTQFYVYGPEGKLQPWAQLDSRGPRSVPHVCTVCHGGYVDSAKNIAIWARFLPLDETMVVFDKEGPASLMAQREAIRKMNLLALQTGLTQFQFNQFHGIYQGKVEVEHAPVTPNVVIGEWSWSEERTNFYNQVLKPYCLTCHWAAEKGRGGAKSWVYEAFQTPELLAQAPMLNWVCGQFSMPNAQATMFHFWTEPRVIHWNGKIHNTAADAFLGFYGITREQCVGYAEKSNCSRSENLCGNNESGQVCDGATGECAPLLSRKALTEPSTPAGYCKADVMGCPGKTVCLPSEAATEGYDGVCTLTTAD